jgi:hypothetical protein
MRRRGEAMESDRAKVRDGPSAIRSSRRRWNDDEPLEAKSGGRIGQVTV